MFLFNKSKCRAPPWFHDMRNPRYPPILFGFDCVVFFDLPGEGLFLVLLLPRLRMQWVTPGPKHHMASAGCCGACLDPNASQRECQIQCQT